METSRRTCTYSFGDNGATATVSPSGRLLRMSKHFPGKRFGYCVDHYFIPQPYAVVDRITPFLASANDPDHNIGFYPGSDWLKPDAESAPALLINDRWPLFKTDGKDGIDKVQYSISDGAVYQTFEFTKSSPSMALVTDLLIRELDFTNGEKDFNNDERIDNTYGTELLNAEKCIKRWHGTGQNNHEHVALFISACVHTVASVDKVAVVFEKVEDNSEEIDGETYRIVWPKATTSGNVNSPVPTPCKITFVYALTFEVGSPASIPTTIELPEPPQIPNMDVKNEQVFINNKDLDTCLRRNLEYILSVCSIPVHIDSDNSADTAIALTCGEIDDHRVATAASFHCFQFLLLALKHFESNKKSAENDNEKPSSYCAYMALRIRKVLRGHLTWVFDERYRNLADDSSCPHTWVNGEEIQGWKTNSYLPPASLVNAPFHLIKAGDFYEYDREWEVPETARRAVKAWIGDLDPKNKLGSYAFPRNMAEPTHNFYLTDHVLIWRAVKAAEILNLKSELFADIPQDQDRSQTKKSQGKRDYSSNKIQNQILKRFTAENPVSKKRMLAVSRSPSHIRFLLRTRDTSLFHAMDSKLFDKPGTPRNDKNEWQNKIDIWKNLVECQRLHEDNDDTSWDEPLRFALSVIMGCKGRSMNSRPPSDTHTHGISVLLEGAWPSRLFPGKFDIDNEPAIYQDELRRDKYWSNTFEIPYYSLEVREMFEQRRAYSSIHV